MFTEKIPNYGDHMKLSEWIECCEDGSFIDYDGFGAASDGQKMTKEYYYPSERNNLPKGATHIVWFNR